MAIAEAGGGGTGAGGGGEETGATGGLGAPTADEAPGARAAREGAGARAPPQPPATAAAAAASRIPRRTESAMARYDKVHLGVDGKDKPRALHAPGMSPDAPPPRPSAPRVRVLRV